MARLLLRRLTLLSSLLSSAGVPPEYGNEVRPAAFIRKLDRPDRFRDFWARVRKARDEQQPPSPRDRLLWCFLKGQQRAEAMVRLIDGLGTDLRCLHNGELRASRVYRDDAQLQAAAAAKRSDLLSKVGLILTRWRGGGKPPVCASRARVGSEANPRQNATYY